MSKRNFKDRVFEEVIKVIFILASKIVDDIDPEKIREYFRGKKIAILGATASGKNSMFNMLMGESKQEEYTQTRGVENVKKFKFKRSFDSLTIDFYCKRSVNVGGESDERVRFWKQACEDADFIFYLVDMHRMKVSEQDTISRVQSDLVWIGSHISRLKEGVKLYILMNKIDLYFDENEEFLMSKCDLIPYVKNSIDQEKNKIQKIAESALSVNKDSLAGVSPMSMKNEDLFNRFFDESLMDLYDKKDDQ